MGKMTHRERVLKALSHEEPDRVPLDFGSSTSTTIIESAYNNLKEYFGLTHENRKLFLRQGSVIPDESVLQRLDIDTRCLTLGTHSNVAFKQKDKNTLVDIWQTTWKRVHGGHYINIDGPFQNTEPSIEQLNRFSWPDPDDPGLYHGLKAKAETIRRKTDCAIVLSLPVGIVHQGQFLRGFAEWLTDLHERPQYIECMSDIITDIWIRIAENALALVGHLVDVVAWGDDLAMQEAPLFNPKLYRKIIKPRHRRMIAAVKAKTIAKLRFHSCGSVYPLIEDLIDIGVDILNPVQIAAKHMEPERLKREFGDRLCFWGGIDTQYLLPFASETNVREGVRSTIDKLAGKGGYILAAVHNIQNDVPPENIAAMFDEGRIYGVYRN